MRCDTRCTTIVAALAASLLLIALPACEDSQAAGERAVASQINEAIAKASKALPGGIFPADAEARLAAATALRSIAQSLASVQGASPGQKSAALMLASSLARQAAALDLSVAGDLEQMHRGERLAVERAASSASSLEALAEPLERVDFASARTALKSQRDQAETQLRQLQSEIKALESAVAQVNRQIDASETEARQLELDADRLRLEAKAMQPRQALPLIEQASEIQRRNAAVRGALGRQQSEKGAIEPQLAGAKALGSGGAAVLQVTDDAGKSLQVLADAARDAAARAKRSASDLRGAGKTRLEVVLASMSESLEPRYQAAIESLERSATLASQAASGTDNDGSDSAKLGKATAEMALARMLWQRASALEDHAALLRRLDAAGGWGQPSQLSAAVSATEASRREATTRAKELYGAAIDTIGQLRTPSRVNSAEVTGLLAQAQRAVKEMDRPGSGGAATTAGGVGDAGGSGSAGGAESPEAIIALFTTKPASADEVRALFSVMKSQQSSELLSSLQGMALAIEPLREACIRKFGSAPAFDGGGGPGGGPSLPTGAKLVSKDETSAVVEFTTAKGTSEGKLMVIDGRWFIDFDALLESSAPGQGAMLASMGPMLGAVTKALQGAAKAVIARIDAGEIDSPAAAEAAFQTEVGKAMQGAMGGGAGQ